MKALKALVVSALMMLAFSAGAQEKSCDKHNNWKEKMEAEKVAFITNRLNLSADEAQKFWPVYNAQNKKIAESFDAIRKSYKALKLAIKEGKDEKEVNSLLENYLKEKENNASLAVEAMKAYKKVLSADKVAKLFVAEEDFRNIQIAKLHQGNPQGGQHQGHGPQGGQHQGHPQQPRQ